MKRYLIIAVLILFTGAVPMNAQKLGLKTNALYWATATPNLGLEVAFADRWTFDLEGGYNPWTFNKENNVKVKHFLVSPEFRYWFCESFNGHFIGINGNYTQFNVGGMSVPYVLEKSSRQEGWAVGTGLTYGYACPISRRWNMEFTLGLGYWYTEYDRFESRKCGLFKESCSKHFFAPTALGISFIYLIK